MALHSDWSISEAKTFFAFFLQGNKFLLKIIHLSNQANFFILKIN